jgi:hypothetical protein
MSIGFLNELVSNHRYFKPFPMSPRNSAAAVTNMMQKTRCRRLITTQHSLASLIDGVKAGLVSVTQTSQLQIDEIPALNYLYPALVSGASNEAIVPYSSPGLPSSENDTLFYLHSSGSTGFPRPIPINNLTAIHWCMTGESVKKSALQTVLRWSGVSIFFRPHRRSCSYPHQYCVLAIIPYSWYNFSAVRPHRQPEQCVCLSAYITPRSLGDPYSTQLAKHLGLRTQD